MSANSNENNEKMRKSREIEEDTGTPAVTTKNLTLGEGDSYMLHPGTTAREQKAREEYEKEKRGQMGEERISDAMKTGQVRQEEDNTKTVSQFAKELEEEEKNRNKQKNKKD